MSSVPARLIVESIPVSAGAPLLRKGVRPLPEGEAGTSAGVRKGWATRRGGGQLYHGTSGKNLSSIMKSGLVPVEGGRNIPRELWITHDQDIALHAARGGDMGHEDPTDYPVLLHLNPAHPAIRKGHWTRDRGFGRGHSSLYGNVAIPFDAVSKIELPGKRGEAMEDTHAHFAGEFGGASKSSAAPTGHHNTLKSHGWQVQTGSGSLGAALYRHGQKPGEAIRVTPQGDWTHSDTSQGPIAPHVARGGNLYSLHQHLTRLHAPPEPAMKFSGYDSERGAGGRERETGDDPAVSTPPALANQTAKGRPGGVKGHQGVITGEPKPIAKPWATSESAGVPSRLVTVAKVVVPSRLATDELEDEVPKKSLVSDLQHKLALRAVMHPDEQEATLAPSDIPSYMPTSSQPASDLQPREPMTRVQPNLSKEAVNYRYAQTSEQSCGTCRHFNELDHACAIVMGMIRPIDTCDQWTTKTRDLFLPALGPLARREAVAMFVKKRHRRTDEGEFAAHPKNPFARRWPRTREDEEAGTPEGAKKGWLKRKGGGGFAGTGATRKDLGPEPDHRLPTPAEVRAAGKARRARMSAQSARDRREWARSASQFGHSAFDRDVPASSEPK